MLESFELVPGVVFVDTIDDYGKRWRMAGDSTALAINQSPITD